MALWEGFFNTKDSKKTQICTRESLLMPGSFQLNTASFAQIFVIIPQKQSDLTFVKLISPLLKSLTASLS